MTERNQTAYITVTVAARRTGVEPHIVRYCVQLGLVSARLTEADLAELRRVRRLTDLGVNLAGVEIILRMRRQIEELRAKIARYGESEGYFIDKRFERESNEHESESIG